LEGVLDTDGRRLDDWHPPDLGLTTVLQVQAGDNHGNYITGIDAVGADIQIGTRITICNANAPQDDGILSFGAEDEHSQPNNRIWPPGYGRNNGQVATTRFTIGPSECDDLIYLQPDQADSTAKRWIVLGPASRLSNTAIKQLGFFPYSRPEPIAGSVDDWDPDDTCPALIGGPLDGTCEGGGGVASTSYTVVLASTVDEAGATITGLKYMSSKQSDGQGPVKLVFNLGPGDLRLPNNDSGSSPMDRFTMRTGGNTSDIVLKPFVGAMFFHLRDAGGWMPMSHSDYLFDSRNVTMTKGLLVSGRDETSGSSNAILTVDNTEQSRPSMDYRNAFVRDVGSYDTTNSSMIAFGLVVAADGTRSAGANTVTNVALDLVAGRGDDNYALWTEAGDVYFGRGQQMSRMYANTAMLDVTGQTKVESTLTLGGGEFTGEAHAAVAAASAVPVLDRGSLTHDSSNFVGRVENVGPHTSVRMAFGDGGFVETSHCITQITTTSISWVEPTHGHGPGLGDLIIVDPSATEPRFNCFASASHSPAYCPNFEYQCWGH